MTLPLEQIFKFYTESTKVILTIRIPGEKYFGVINGFDEHMNIVFNENNRIFLIKGDCISGIFSSK